MCVKDRCHTWGKISSKFVNTQHITNLRGVFLENLSINEKSEVKVEKWGEIENATWCIIYKNLLNACEIMLYTIYGRILINIQEAERTRISNWPQSIRPQKIESRFWFQNFLDLYVRVRKQNTSLEKKHRHHTSLPRAFGKMFVCVFGEIPRMCTRERNQNRLSILSGLMSFWKIRSAWHKVFG